jgi:hypothetical protein
MASITSVAARYSGTVTFTDNSKEYFHCQMEDSTLWSEDASGSNTAQVPITWTTNDAGAYPYYVRQNLVWEGGMPFLSDATLDTTQAAVTKTINGLAMRGEILFALDDNTTWASSMSYDSHFGYQWTNDGTTAPDNLSTYVDAIETMLLQIFDSVTFTIA